MTTYFFLKSEFNITRLIFAGVGFDNLAVKPHMGNGHSVLCQGSCFIWADGRCWPKSFHSLQVLDQAVLLRHSFGGERQADSDGGQETFRYVGYDDTDQENNDVQPVVAESQGDDEKGNSQEDGHSGNDVNEMFNLFGNWSLSRAQTGGQTGDTTHHCVVTDTDDNTFCGTWNETKMTSKFCNTFYELM